MSYLPLVLRGLEPKVLYGSVLIMSQASARFIVFAATWKIFPCKTRQSHANLFLVQEEPYSFSQLLFTGNS